MADIRARITIQLQPRASRSEVLDWNAEGSLRVRVKAPPVAGAANKELIQLLARQLHVAKTRVTLISGATGRKKIIGIEDLTVEEVRTRLTRP